MATLQGDAEPLDATALARGRGIVTTSGRDIPRAGTLLNAIERELFVRSRNVSDDAMRIRGIWRMDHLCRPIPEERLLRFGFVMLQTEHPGCCYTGFGEASIADWERYIGADVRRIAHQDVPVRIAAADAWAAALSRRPDRDIVLDGAPTSKAQARARHVADLLEAVAPTTRKLRVALIGVIGAFAIEILRRGHDVVAADYDQQLIRDGIAGVPVLSGDLSPELAQDADIALVCGEALINDTLSEVLAGAVGARTPVVIYAVTGASLASLYVDTFGAAAVLSEPQPQYLFHGRTHLGVFQRTYP